MRNLFIFTAICLPLLSSAQQNKPYRHALGVGWDGYLTLDLRPTAQAGLWYDFSLFPNSVKSPLFLSTGLQYFGDDSESVFVAPLEVALKTTYWRSFLYVGGGGMFHTKNEYLSPAFLGTLKAGFRFRSKGRFYLDLHARGFFSDRSSLRYNPYPSPAGKREPVFSPGFGLSMGLYL